MISDGVKDFVKHGVSLLPVRCVFPDGDSTKRLDALAHRFVVPRVGLYNRVRDGAHNDGGEVYQFHVPWSYLKRRRRGLTTIGS